MVESQEDIEISSSTGANFKEVVMEQFRQVTKLSNVEFRGGFYTVTTTRNGEEREVYVEDTREVFANGVYALGILLKPKFDKEMWTVYNKFKRLHKKLQAEFMKDSSVEEEIVLGEGFYETAKDKVLLETYKMRKLKLFQGLFNQLSLLLDRHNYLGIGGMTFG